MRILLGLILIFTACSSYGDHNWQFSGFGSLGVGKVNREDYQFGEADNNWDFDNDTRLGIQLQGNLTERLAFTTQVSSSGLALGGEESYNPKLQWLFLSYQATPDLQLRLGRLRSSYYIYSGTRDVGYSYPWARPPIDVYTYLLQPLGNIDGADLQYTLDMSNDLELDILLFVGEVEGEIRDVTVESNPTYGATFTLRSLDWLLRYSFHIEHTDIRSEGLQTAVDYYEDLSELTGDPIFNEIGSALYAEGTNYQYHAIGGQWDFNSWGIIAEKYWVLAPDSGFANDSDGWYVSLLYHYNEFTPYTVLSAYDNTLDKDTLPLIDEAAAQYPFAAPLLEQTRAGIQSFKAKERSITLGVRYDFMANTCIKFEVQYFDFLAGSTGQGFPLNDADPPDNATLMTIVMDVVF
ncbi:hypothetical protein [Ketobacter sp.]|uniref:hypothetical protein n=1 Tax=Ketobacter sp. TaxID=2083498 RepID=UPI000F179F94|nr:hypothetical protein [Ketobacter sp.]RLT94503.1 MAG: hypothetical protein D9N14_16765 [Ketobacter sp.]